ncbi:hypothetical protein FACS1894151_01480 [Spirochaetia bacterium]|nr:hypothetical protein FACS1894151_01480 [Spirochaetia bacterium]
MAGSVKVFAETQWYISNAAGMALEAGFSRLVLRSEYALAVEDILLVEIPSELQVYYVPDFKVELRTLYRNSEAIRNQWIFRDMQNRTRLTAARELLQEQVPEESADAPDESADTAESFVFFIERYDEEGILTEERRIDDGIETIQRYFYNRQMLIRCETSVAENGITENVYTDYYRYSRSYSLRSVDRIFSGAQAAAAAAPVTLRFPRLMLGQSGFENFVTPAMSYGTEFMNDIVIAQGYRVSYTVDNSGRIVTETRRDDEGTIIGELQNTWSADRLLASRWTAGEDERLTEYEYNERGDRIAERNYNKGILERLVYKNGDEEVEELYLNGRAVLRAVWKDGRKISEQRLRPGQNAAD